MNLELLMVILTVLIRTAVPSVRPEEPSTTPSASESSMFPDEGKVRQESLKASLLHPPCADCQPSFTANSDELERTAKAENSKEDVESIYSESCEAETVRDFYIFRHIGGGSDNYHYKFNFSISKQLSSRQELSATLLLYKETVSPQLLVDRINVEASTVLSIHQVLPDGMRHLASAAVVDLDRPGWITLDVSQVVRNWAAEPAANLGLIVDSAANGQNVSSLVSFDTHSTSRSPALHVRIRQPSHRSGSSGKRKRRSRGGARHQGLGQSPCAGGRCCRKHIYVPFKTLRWDWIIDPPGFDAYYCEGKCLKSHEPANTNFGELKRLLRMMNVANLTSSCIPTKHSALTVWHLDIQGNLASRTMKDMVVESCGCA